MSDDVVTRLPVSYVGPIPGRSLVAPWEVKKHEKCGHLFTTYIVDETKAHVECGACHTPLNPMWVLKMLATEDRRSAEAVERAKKVNQRLEERLRVKCDHCHKMTRIRKP